LGEAQNVSTGFENPHADPAIGGVAAVVEARQMRRSAFLKTLCERIETRTLSVLTQTIDPRHRLENSAQSRRSVSVG
jgi:hypothetical protein